MSDLINYSESMDLVYSEDDGGWYWQRFPSGETSQVFRSIREAKTALRSGAVEWK